MATYLPFYSSYSQQASAGQNPYMTMQPQQQQAQPTPGVSPQRASAQSQYDQALQNAGFLRPFSQFSQGMAPMYGGFQYGSPQSLQGFVGGMEGVLPDGQQQPPVDGQQVSMPNTPAGPGGYLGIMDFIRGLRGGGYGGVGGGGEGGLGSAEPPSGPITSQPFQPVSQPEPPQGGSKSITEEERRLSQKHARGSLTPEEHTRRKAVLQRLNAERLGNTNPLVAKRSTYKPNLNPVTRYY